MPKVFANSFKMWDSVTRFCGVPVPWAWMYERRRTPSSPTTARANASALATVR